jgi:hypothetical protein
VFLLISESISCIFPRGGIYLIDTHNIVEICIGEAREVCGELGINPHSKEGYTIIKTNTNNKIKWLV